jgi:hypothetical protein
MSNHPDFQLLCDLIRDLSDSGLTPDQQRQLRDLLLESDELKSYYVDHMMLHAGLLFESPAFSEPLTIPRTAGPQPTASRRRALVIRLAVAATIVLATVTAVAVLMSLAPRPAGPSLGPAVATLIDSTSAVWQENTDAPKIGDQLRNGWLKLKSGSAQIEFTSGAQVTLTGPAEFGLNSPMRGLLRRGSLHCLVPRQAHGFTLGAPGCVVVDLGTEFSLAINPAGQAEVRVVQGRVAIQREGQPDREFTAGQAVAVRDELVDLPFATPTAPVAAAVPPVAGQVLWLAADANVVSTRDAVAEWKDASGNGKQWIKSVVGHPTLAAGQFSGGVAPVVRFDGASSLLLRQDRSLDLQSLCIYIVAIVDPQADRQQVLFGNYIANHGFAAGLSDSVAQQAKWYTGPPGDPLDDGGSNVRPGVPCVLAFTVDAATLAKTQGLSTDGVNYETQTAVDNALLTYDAGGVHAAPALGGLAAFHAEFVRAGIAEVIVYNRVDPQTQADIQSYLRSKYFTVPSKRP